MHHDSFIKRKYIRYRINHNSGKETVSVNNYARKDVVPALFLLLISLFVGKFWLRAFGITAIVFYLLYLTKLVQPRGIFIPPRPAKNSDFYEAMYTHPHVAIMPDWLYTIYGVIYFIISVVLFLIVPVSRYFYNWSKMMFGMASNKKLQPVPQNDVDIPLPQNPQPQNQRVPHPDPVAPNRNPYSAGSTQSRQVAPRNPWQRGFGNRRPPGPNPSESSQRAAQEAVERSMISSMERNLDDLKQIRANSEKLLDTIFGGSRISKARFLSGLDSAVEMAEKNLAAAREYLQVGHNPEILKNYLDRSNKINKAAAELLDSLAAHQQNEMEDDFTQMTDSLDELQRSVSLYD